MRSPLPDYLARIMSDCAGDLSGENADYIPELAKADPNRFALALATVDGQVYATGDAHHAFTIQSISKPFVYALALADCGFDEVMSKVDVEPSGEAFNELSLEQGSKRPRNPMINSGALAAHAMLGDGGTRRQRVEHIIEGLSTFAGRDLSIDHSAYQSEIENAHRNLSIAHMLRNHDIISADPVDVVNGYVEQCSVLVTTRDLAMMAATLANGGIQPFTEERVVSESVVRQVLSVMMSCGMYDSAGDWLTTVGIPAKSGVAGGVIGSLPGQLGVAGFSPRLDQHGSSVRAVKAFEQLSNDMGMHIMDVAAPARGVVRFSDLRSVGGREVHVYELNGVMRFASAERVVRMVVDDPPEADAVLFDLTDVFSLDSIARRLMIEIGRRLVDHGKEVWMIDPDGVVRNPDSVDEIRLVDSIRDVDDVIIG